MIATLSYPVGVHDLVNILLIRAVRAKIVRSVHRLSE